MPVTFTDAQLRTIGMACKNRLPPASAMQSMFLYEMQRDAENERLFQHQFFRIAKQEDESKLSAERVKKLEARLVQLEEQVTAKDAALRLATSETRMTVQIEKGKATALRVDGIEAQISAIQDSLATLTTAQASSKEAVAARPALADDPDFRNLQKNLARLFNDRDELQGLVKGLQHNLSKLEDNIRALTAQRATAAQTSPVTSSPAVQHLPLQSVNGTHLALGVPKGAPHVSVKDKPTSAATKLENRIFVPGGPTSAGMLARMQKMVAKNIGQ